MIKGPKKNLFYFLSKLHLSRQNVISFFFTKKSKLNRFFFLLLECNGFKLTKNVKSLTHYAKSCWKVNNVMGYLRCRW